MFHVYICDLRSILRWSRYLVSFNPYTQCSTRRVMKKIHAWSQFHQEAQTIIILGDLCSHSIILSLKKLAKFQSMIIFVIHSKRWWETVPMPQLKLDHYFWNLIYAKTHLSLSKNKTEHKLALLKQYKMPFRKRCSQSSNNNYC